MCIHIYIYIYTYVYIYIYIYIYICSCTHSCINILTHTNIVVCVYIYIYIYICVCEAYNRGPPPPPPTLGTEFEELPNGGLNNYQYYSSGFLNITIQQYTPNPVGNPVRLVQAAILLARTIPQVYVPAHTSTTTPCAC